MSPSRLPNNRSLAPSTIVPVPFSSRQTQHVNTCMYVFVRQTKYRVPKKVDNKRAPDAPVINTPTAIPLNNSPFQHEFTSQHNPTTSQANSTQEQLVHHTNAHNTATVQEHHTKTNTTIAKVLHDFSLQFYLNMAISTWLPAQTHTIPLFTPTKTIGGNIYGTLASYNTMHHVTHAHDLGCNLINC